jgi:hypothetical protein
MTIEEEIADTVEEAVEDAQDDDIADEIKETADTNRDIQHAERITALEAVTTQHDESIGEFATALESINTRLDSLSEAIDNRAYIDHEHPDYMRKDDVVELQPPEDVVEVTAPEPEPLPEVEEVPKLKPRWFK